MQEIKDQWYDLRQTAQRDIQDKIEAQSAPVPPKSASMPAELMQLHSKAPTIAKIQLLKNKQRWLERSLARVFFVRRFLNT